MKKDTFLISEKRPIVEDRYSTKAPISSRINIRKFIYFTQEKASKIGIHCLLINSSSLLKCSRGVPSRKSRTEKPTCLNAIK